MGKMYFRGIPMEPDIRNIREQYPEYQLKPGQSIPYEDISRILKVEKDSRRFRTVTARWRDLVASESSHEIGVEPNVGFKVLTEDEKVDKSSSHIRRAGNQFVRAARVSSNVDRKELSDSIRVRFDKNNMVLGTVQAYLQIKSRKVEFPQLVAAGR